MRLIFGQRTLTQKAECLNDQYQLIGLKSCGSQGKSYCLPVVTNTLGYSIHLYVPRLQFVTKTINPNMNNDGLYPTVMC